MKQIKRIIIFMLILLLASSTVYAKARISGARVHSSSKTYTKSSTSKSSTSTTNVKGFNSSGSTSKKYMNGDIVYVISKDENAFILWDNVTSRYIIQFESYCADFDNYYGKELEVIGNIYENKNLLGQEDK